MIGIVLALFSIATGLILTLALTNTAKPSGIRPAPYSVNRSEEVPLSSHRTRSMVATQATTALMPWGIAFDYVHGFVWVAEPGCDPSTNCPSTTAGILGQYALSDGNFIQNFNEPGGFSSPLFAAVDTGGHVWFTEPYSHAIGEFDPQHEVWNQWSVKKGGSPYDLTFDAHGNLWFTEFGANNIGFFNPKTHTLVENPIPTPNSNPYGITVDPHGTIWFTENRNGLGQIASFTPTLSGIIKITEHAVNAQRPHLITSDRAGNIWYSDGFSGDVGKFDPTSGNSKSFQVYTGTCLNPPACTGTHISGIYVDSKGDVWFSDSLSQRVGYLIPSTGQVVAQKLNYNNAHPYDGLTIDSSDRVWFTEEYALTLTMWPASMVK